MKTTSFWVIRIALVVQFISVLSVPALLASNEAPRGTWMAEWVPPSRSALWRTGLDSGERTIGVLKLRDGKLAFTEQIGETAWEIDLASVKRVAIANQGRSVVIVSTTGQEFVVSIMNADLTQTSPKKLASTIARAIQSLATNSR
jgi:hypothetical protein